MKKRINSIVVLLLVSMGSIYAKGVKKKFVAGFGLSTALSQQENRLSISPFVLLDFKRTKIEIGPSFLTNVGTSNIQNGGIGFSGVQSAFHFTPNYQEEKTINFSLIGQIIYHRTVLEDVSKVWNIQTQSFDDNPYKNVNNAFELYGGYGLNIRISKYISLFQVLGIGAVVTSDLYSSDLNQIESSPRLGFGRLMKLGVKYSLISN